MEVGSQAGAEMRLAPGLGDHALRSCCYLPPQPRKPNSLGPKAELKPDPGPSWLGDPSMPGSSVGWGLLSCPRL